MSYANAGAVPYVALVGENEMQQGVVSLKDMNSGEQMQLTIDEVIAKIKG
jgi:histidyl-tRNA synthetase